MYDRTVIERVVQLRESGVEYAAIGRQLGLTADQVSGIYRRFKNGQRTPAPAITIDDLVKPPGEAVPAAAPTPPAIQHPKGWEPGVVLEGNRGTISSGPTERNPDWDEVLRRFGFDPKLFEIVEPVNVRTWDAAIGEGQVRQMWYHRANIVRRRSHEDHVDVEALAKEIRRHRSQPSRPTGRNAFVVCASDWQLGKSDGNGSRGVVDRVLATTDAIVARIRELRNAGRELGVLYYAGMGDLVEACSGQYDMQTFSVDLDRRQQIKVARRLVLHQLRLLAPLFERVVCVCVPGNHGENRRNGKAYTTFGDNDDVALFEQVAEILQENPATYGHVSFVLPDQELVVVLDVCGTTTAFAHGHQAKTSGSPQAKIESWWRGQQAGRQPAGDADLLITGHYHHLAVTQAGVRTHIQCPSMESDSAWFRHAAGLRSPPGMLTLTVGPDGWSDLQVLRPTPETVQNEAA